MSNEKVKNILVMDTSCARLLVAVFVDGKVYSKSDKSGLKRHNSELLCYINEMLKAANVTISNIDGVAAVSGPGSFTGVRVGVSTANAFSSALDIPAVGVSSLDIVSAASEGAELSLIDAGHGNFYALNRGKKCVMNMEEVRGFSGTVAYFDEDYDPSILIKLAKTKLLSGCFENPIVPDYMRRSQAERMLEGDE